MKKSLNTTVVFEKNYTAPGKIVINQGSSRSGKTYSILQLLIFVKALQKPGTVITIVRKTLPALKMTAMRDFFEIINSHDLYEERFHNKTDNTYMFNGCMFEFISMDQPQKKRGAKRHYLFINELNELTFEDWVQLVIRTEVQVFGDFNPSVSPDHWIYEKVIPRDDCTFIHSTYKDNPFLPRAIVEEIEKLRDIDDVYWQVYGLGLPGEIKGTILKNWEIVESMPPDEDCKWISFGIDYGFSIDPTSVIKVASSDGFLWVDEYLYSRGLVATELSRLMNEVGVPQTAHIVCDRKPELIFEMKRLGYLFEPAYKPPGIVKTRIDILQRFRIKITKRSVNTIQEFRNYKWRETADGISINEPIDKWNHSIDALGYVVTSRELLTKRKVRWTSIKTG